MDNLDLMRAAIDDMKACYEKLGMDRHIVLFHQYPLSGLKEMQKAYNKTMMSVGTLETIVATLEMNKEMMQSFRACAGDIDGLIEARSRQEEGYHESREP